MILIFVTENEQVKRLPWHLWNLFEDYPNILESFSTQKFQKTEPRRLNTGNCVKILAILGNSVGINIKKDLSLLKQLPNTKLKFLVEPERKQLNDSLWFWFRKSYQSSSK